MASSDRTFRSRVALRMFGVFSLCALIPIATFAFYSYSRVADQLEADAALALGAEAKSTGMSIFERLLIAKSELERLAAYGADEREPHGPNSNAFLSWTLLPARAQAEVLRAHADALPGPGSVRLHFAPTSQGFAVLLDLRTDQGIFRGELDPGFVFTPERRAYGDRYWLEDAEGRLLFAAAEDDDTAALLRAPAGARTDRETFGLDGPEGRELAVLWPIFLDAPFKVSELRVGISRTQELIHHPLNEFEQTFPVMAALALILAVVIALRQVRRTLDPLDALADAAGAMSRGDYSERVEITSRDEFGKLGGVFNAMAQEIQSRMTALRRLYEIGISLSSEDGVDQVIEKIVDGAATLASAQACALFLVDESKGEETTQLSITLTSASNPDPDGTEGSVPHLPEYPRFEALWVCKTGVSIRVDAADQRTPAQREEWERFERDHGAAIGSLLAVPLHAEGSRIAGALLVIRERSREAGFSDEEMSVVRSLASQAALSIRQARLVENLRALFEGLIQLTVRAIDEKSPYTGDHCRKVPILAEIITQAAVDATEGPLKDFVLTPEERYELKIAALLHDCGKMVTPVHVMDKATKLETIYDRIETVRLRGEIVRRDHRLASAGLEVGEAASADFEQMLRDDLAFIERCNIGGEYLDEAAQARIEEISQRYRWRDLEGATCGLIGDQDVENLKVSRGTLNHEERKIIEGHVTTTMRLLEELPFPREMQNVPSIAGAHHEAVNGCGYPLGLSGEDLTMQGRILGLADIFEALTAKDRPYKPGMTLSRSLDILGRMVDDGLLDRNLYELFVRERLYLGYAVEHMDPNQIDGEHRDALIEMTSPWS